ncbi:MAG: hypothetical protein GQ548_00620 [Methylophaga sp.]|nr:hypothetical protein [Methylophaga sp.]
MSSLAKHVIHQPKPYRCLLIVAVTIVITILIQWFLIKENSEHRQKELINVQQKVDSFTQENRIQDKTIQQLELENKQLLTKNAEHQSGIAIQQATVQQLQLQLTELQQQVMSLNKDLFFYQSITQGNSSSKLQIRELHLRADDIRTDIIRYRVVITQGKKINKPITGTIKITLNSDNNGIIEQQTLEQHKLNLRHVQVLEGQIKIADNTKPLTLTVDLIQNKKTTLSQTFDWQLAPNN